MPVLRDALPSDATGKSALLAKRRCTRKRPATDAAGSVVNDSLDTSGKRALNGRESGMGVNKNKPTLYELLDVPTAASGAQLQAAFRFRMNALEADRAALSRDDFNDKSQLLRVAYSTLADPVSRAGYDASLEAAAARASSLAGGALSASVLSDGGAGASVEARADALSMRADALALRADALLLRAGAGAASHSAGLFGAADIFGGLKRVVRAIGLLAVLGVGSFALTRCASEGSAQRRAVIEQQASEQAALQEYFQTHGVRPANMADLEMLEASRRRQEKERRDVEQARRQQEQSERNFLEQSHQIGREVSERLQRAEDAERERVQRQQQLKFQADQLKLESELASNDADRRRLELQRKQVLEQLQKP